MLPFAGSVWPLSPNPVITTEVAPCVVQLKTTGLPADVENSGVCEKVRILTGPTVNVAVAVTEPVPLKAVRMYVVVEVGETVAQSAAFTVPIPGLIDTVVAFSTFQQS